MNVVSGGSSFITPAEDIMTATRSLLIAALALAASTIPAVAEGELATASTAPGPQPMTHASLTLTLESQGDIERKLVTYLCDDGQAIAVQYVNAAPNFLAVVPVAGQNQVFATTLSASGARYVSGPFEWWSHQGEATLRDLTQDEDAPPLATCTQATNTP